jgi:hypothetical protein
MSDVEYGGFHNGTLFFGLNIVLLKFPMDSRLSNIVFHIYFRYSDRKDWILANGTRQNGESCKHSEGWRLRTTHFEAPFDPLYLSPMFAAVPCLLGFNLDSLPVCSPRNRKHAANRIPIVGGKRLTHLII